MRLDKDAIVYHVTKSLHAAARNGWLDINRFPPPPEKQVMFGHWFDANLTSYDEESRWLWQATGVWSEEIIFIDYTDDELMNAPYHQPTHWKEMDNAPPSTNVDNPTRPQGQP